MSGIADVARLAGVSKSTASRALSGGGYVATETRERVEEAAAMMGFVASSSATSLVTGRHLNVAMLTPSVTRWFFTEVIEGVEGALVDSDFDMTLYRLGSGADARRRVFDYFLMRKRVDAVIAVGVALSTVEVDVLRTLGKPIVGIGGPIAGIPTLGIDETAASRTMTEHLVELGHTRLVHFGGDGDEQRGFSTQARRLRGFRAAVRAAGIDIDHDFVRTPFSIPGGYETAKRELADPRTRPTAVVAACDEIAIGVILAARELGIVVPQQLSVVGIDDHHLASLFGLTTLRQHPSRQGSTAVRMVLDALAKPSDAPAPVSQTTSVNVVVRSSTAPPAG